MATKRLATSAKRSLRLPKLPTAAHLVRRVEFPYRAPQVPDGVAPPSTERRTGAYYDTDWARRAPARVTRRVLLDALTRPAIRVVADPEIRGVDRLDQLDAPVIFAANHHSHLDTPLLLASLPRRFRHDVFVGAAADYFFANRVTSAASALALNAIPIERTRVTRRAATLASELLGDGWNMVIFPEGGRSPDGWGQPFRGGAAFLAVRCEVPVVPVHVLGTDRLLRKGAKRLRVGSTVVTFGDPISPADVDGDVRALGSRLEAAVAALADEATSDWWSARRRAHARATPALTGPDAGGWRRAWALGDRRPHRRTARRDDSSRRWPDLGGR
jgi:1-acyl-sn-glycerol-3-phosphate acyltransferase